MNKLTLIKNIDEAIANNCNIAIIIENTIKYTVINGTYVKKRKELIINRHENLADKRSYYFDNYDEDCRLNSNPNIRIIAIYKDIEFAVKNYLEA